MNERETIQKMSDLLQSPKNWCQNRMTIQRDDDVVAHCLLGTLNASGAIAVMAPSTVIETEVFHHVIRRLVKALTTLYNVRVTSVYDMSDNLPKSYDSIVRDELISSIVSWNDNPTRTFEDVRRLLDYVIADIESEVVEEKELCEA